MQLTATNPVHVVEPQDEAMDSFRKSFKLVANCNVSGDGMVMTYQLKALPTAARWLSDAQAVIIANQMPLEASVKAYVKKGQTVPCKVELRIVYNPPVAKPDHSPAIDFTGINEHLQHAFKGITY